MSRSVSRHFVTEKVRALCVVSDVLYASETLQEEYEVLPLVATGGWDNETNHVSLHLPVRPTRDEHELRKERGEDDVRPCELNTLAEEEHAGDANALQFVATRGENLLISASSAGGVFAFRVSSSAGDDEAAMTDGDSAKPLTAFTVQQWEQVFAGTAATCLEVSENRTSIVTASAGGALAWLKLDDTVSVEKIEIKDTSRLPINAVKFMGRDTVVATVGSLPGSQLRVWDLAANNKFPIATCVDILTTLETHPTRPEMLITGGDDGSVRFWDRRKLDAPFRTEGYHHRAVRALKLHSASPRNLFTGGDDAVVNCWDFHHGRSPRDPGGLQVQPIVSGSQPWNALAIHAESDTLVAGSDAQSVVIIQHVSK
ncbi:uncharacterized protein PITG_16121 [Phytophthora infestans T30-4]|uniref:Uncharacterized protein n=1 Tax=Phytophthora infestans (strain T30-4) TaxID=403677 RepID=D0NSY0_PHYIT|nr:uncharacterized protein PITG_16121 [Phytophthora infestans T30-4]EEY64692.1 conserved hypothetical protein [Phytophthora infestans T30-4]|eukprot:XP_002897892.1 conserved hypothetical protein [Phytophthora infestans T30-4]